MQNSHLNKKSCLNKVVYDAKEQPYYQVANFKRTIKDELVVNLSNQQAYSVNINGDVISPLEKTSIVNILNTFINTKLIKVNLKSKVKSLAAMADFFKHMHECCSDSGSLSKREH